MFFFYNIFFPLAFILFIPGMVYKLIRRPGHKQTYLERFAIFAAERKQLLRSFRGAVWIHSVSVGETMIALSMIKKWKAEKPDLKIVLSTTTTTGQELARNKISDDIPVFYCPIDFILFVKKVVALIQPSMLVIFETELWPNMIREARNAGAKVALVNGRMSDKSFRGYSKFRMFFQPILDMFDDICVQSEMDEKRFAGIASHSRIHNCGNLKFDQNIPHSFPDMPLKDYFGEGEFLYILAASTHLGEEKLIAETYLALKKNNPKARLIIIPRHAERGNDIVNDLNSLDLNFHRKTENSLPEKPVDCLLADTTGEMLGFINCSDIVIMGKSLAGHDEGHNLIEPSLMAKPVVTGSVLKNFRYVLNVLKEADALVTIDSDSDLKDALQALISDEKKRLSIGEKAKAVIEKQTGATERVINVLNKHLKPEV